MSGKKRPPTEARFDLASIRKLRRLTRRVVAGLDAIERHLRRMDRADRQRAASVAEIEAATEMYRAADELERRDR